MEFNVLETDMPESLKGDIAYAALTGVWRGEPDSPDGPKPWEMPVMDGEVSHA